MTLHILLICFTASLLDLDLTLFMNFVIHYLTRSDSLVPVIIIIKQSYYRSLVNHNSVIVGKD